MSRRMKDRRTRSERFLDDLISAIPHEVPFRRDFSTWELRACVPALETGYHPDLIGQIRGIRGSSNFTIFKALAVGSNPARHDPENLSTLAQAVISFRSRWFAAFPVHRALLRICAAAEWDALNTDLALEAAHAAFRIGRSVPLWRRYLAQLARVERWEEVCGEARWRPLLTRLARGELTRTRLVDKERILAAELIAKARSTAGNSGRNLARDWMLPLISRSTERFLLRTTAARRLSEQLETPAHVTAAELARAIEQGIAPIAPGNYSNLRAAFSPATWERLHDAFRNAGIFTELQRFACEHDRNRFWRFIASKGSIA